jgi:hypothetical protein
MEVLQWLHGRKEMTVPEFYSLSAEHSYKEKRTNSLLVNLA